MRAVSRGKVLEVGYLIEVYEVSDFCCLEVGYLKEWLQKYASYSSGEVISGNNYHYEFGNAIKCYYYEIIISFINKSYSWKYNTKSINMSLYWKISHVNSIVLEKKSREIVAQTWRYPGQRSI
jgi:hypothetical protein